MTVMIPLYFGVPQIVMRNGLWAKLKPGTKDLYTYLCYKSERFSSREFTATDREISDATGTRPRTLCNARKQALEYGLIRYKATSGNKYRYIMCNPETGEPFVGDPKQKVPHKAIDRDGLGVRKLNDSVPITSEQIFG